MKKKYIWEDPSKFAIGKEPGHAIFMPYDSKDAAVRGEESPYKINLAGKWSFYWQQGVDNIPFGFQKIDFDDSEWDTIDVPSVWQLKGYGKPIYKCNNYPKAISTQKSKIPQIDHSRQEVGIYRRTVNIPLSWRDKQIYIHFAGVKSCFTLYVNGQMAGYSQGSMTPAEFNITDLLTSGENTICAEVYRYSDGTYLEDQDMWFLSGIYRELYIFAEEKTMVKDFYFKTDFTSDFNFSDISLDVFIKDYAHSDFVTLRTALLDGGQEIELGIKKIELTGEDTAVNYKYTMQNPRLWSAEYPNLYKLIFELYRGDELLSVKAYDVGFRKFEIRGNRLFCNGTEIMIKGVNRHEFDPDNAWAVPESRFYQDFELMKKANVNAVRTSHYPNSPIFYDFANRYGMYVMDECDLETHGVRRKNCPGDDPRWTAPVIDRMERMVLRDRNIPCIFMWSLGNEAGGGSNFLKMKEAALKLDNTRNFHYEGDFDFEASDVISRMYPDGVLMKKMGEQQVVKTSLYDNIANSLAADNKPIPKHVYKDHPVILCEYAHAMENSLGNFQEYMDDFEKYENMCGGFIWDFVDQSIRVVENGTEKWCYGGDFGEGENDSYYCANGIVGADRTPQPSYYEVAKVYGEFRVKPVDISKGRYEIWNKYSFRPLSDFNLIWVAETDGAETARGEMTDVEIPPHSKVEVNVPYVIGDEDIDCTLTFYLVLKEDTLWAKAGFVQAWDQVVLCRRKPKTLDSVNKKLTCTKNGSCVDIKGDSFEVKIKHGFISSINYGGKEMLKSPIKPNYARAFTDNDYSVFNFVPQFKWLLWHQTWPRANKTMFPLRVKVRSLPGLVRVEVNLFVLMTLKAKLIYEINGNGEIRVTHEFLPLQNANRIGTTFKLSKEFDTVQWYGRGPWENYWDRKTGARLSKYTCKAKDLEHRYMRPQENGNREDCEYVTFSSRDDVLRFSQSSEKELSFSAWYYDQQSLEKFEHTYEIEYQDDLTVNIDYGQCGVGGDMPGMAHQRPQYKLKAFKKYKYSYIISNS